MKINDQEIKFGNAHDDRNALQWLMGHFIKPQSNLLFDEKLEIKWGEVKAGYDNGQWSKSNYAKTIAILVHGEFIMSFQNQDVVLKKEGDYVIWGPGIVHMGKAVKDTVLITLRWPSLCRDDVEIISH
ncbi:MAG: signal peptidase I [Candidatus Portnoybacteria bacterium]|nr:signal peptidase I [Candidatus Portnoybacteria bacterium]